MSRAAQGYSEFGSSLHAVTPKGSPSFHTLGPFLSPLLPPTASCCCLSLKWLLIGGEMGLVEKVSVVPEASLCPLGPHPGLTDVSAAVAELLFHVSCAPRLACVHSSRPEGAVSP